jgi:hypothetical protein
VSGYGLVFGSSPFGFAFEAPVKQNEAGQVTLSTRIVRLRRATTPPTAGYGVSPFGTSPFGIF